jgi:hypothetical protein
VVFFEGFNFSDGEATNLNPAYWSSSSGYGFQGGRTGNGVRIPSRGDNTPLSNNPWLKLSNFTDPLATYSHIGIGFWINAYSIRSSNSAYTESNFENLFSLTTSNGMLSIDIARPSDNYGALLVVRENGTTMGSYDFRSAAGNNWSHNNIGFNGGVASYIGNDMYLDFVFNAVNGSFSVRAAGGNTLSTPLYNSNGSATTTITSFSSVTEVKLYGHQYLPNWTGSPRVFDDFYFTAGNAVSDVFLGPNTRIYRLGVASVIASSYAWQQDNNGSSWESALGSNNGDGNYIKSSGGGQTLHFTMGDLPGDAPAYVQGLKVINVVRKAGLDNQQMVNIMASTSNDTPQEIGPTYSIPSETYSVKENVFLTNPITESDWTTTAVNNMVLGVKNKTVVI